MTKNPRKQRKLLHTAPAHIRHSMLSSILSPKLREKHGIRSLPVRKGDNVTIIRGEHEEREGKVARVDSKKYRLYVEGVTRERRDGTTLLIPIHPSKIMIKKLNLDDQWRKKILDRKATMKAKRVKVTSKKNRVTK